MSTNDTTPVPASNSFNSLDALESATSQAASILNDTSFMDTPANPTESDSVSDFQLPASDFEPEVLPSNPDYSDRTNEIGNPEVDTQVADESVIDAPEVSLESAYEAELKKENRTQMNNVLINAVSSSKGKTNTVLKDKIKALPRADVNNIQIVDDSSDPLAVEKNLSILREADISPATPVIAFKSAYRASMSPMSNSEKIALRNLSGSAADQTLKLVNLIHRKISESSIGKMSFQEFLKITAEEDYETLLYGIYASTYPNAVEYRLTCPHCGTVLNVKIEPKYLIQVLDTSTTGAYVQKLLDGYQEGRAFLKDALVNNISREELDVSRMIFEFRTPSLEHMLRNQREIARLQSSYESELVGLMRFIKAVYVPKLDNYTGGAIQYSTVSNNEGVLDILNTLSSEDIRQVRKTIASRSNTYRIDYKIPTINCSQAKCSKAIEDITIDMTQLLFTGITAETMV